MERLCALECMIAAQTLAIAKLHKQGEKIMATLAEVQAKIVQVKADIVSEKAEVQAALAALKTEIQALKDQIASGGGAVTAADLDGLIASIDEIDTGVKDISEPTV
jgi:predicted  nucleic acid-binding Zn-ribbon protein